MKKRTPAKSIKKITPVYYIFILIIIAGTAIIIFTWRKYFDSSFIPQTPSSEPETSVQPTVTSTPQPTITATPQPTATTTPRPSATVVPEPTRTPEPTITPDTDIIDISGLSNEKRGWWYTPGGNPGVPSTIPLSISTLMNKYDGVWQGDTNSKKIYITMDVGYEYNNNTTRILDIAKDKNFKLNFFITGTILKDNNLKQLAIRMNNEGHLVGNHSYNHPSFPILLSEEGVQSVINEMKSVENSYFELTGSNIAPFMRPPMGEYSEATTYIMQKLGYKSVFWSFAYRDWLTDDQPEESYALQFISDNLHNGSVLLLHTVSDTNVKILPDLIDKIRQEGYEISLLSEME